MQSLVEAVNGGKPRRATTKTRKNIVDLLRKNMESAPMLADGSCWDAATVRRLCLRDQMCLFVVYGVYRVYLPIFENGAFISGPHLQEANSVIQAAQDAFAKS